MSEDQGSERDAPRPSSSRRSAVLFVKQRAGLLCPEGKPSKNKRSGFAIAPILYILGLVGVGAGVLFSGYSQILRSNITISNNVAAKNELSGAATTLAATAELSTDASLFCPPRSSHQSTGEPCVNAPEKLVQFADVDAGDASKLPTDYDAADDDGSPEEVGVFAAGSGLKQLDPWGHFYIYCRWENARADGSDPAILLISAGANNKLESNCASTVAQNDDQMIRLNVGEAIQRAALWQATGTADVRYGATGSQVLVTASGDVTALTMTASMLSITGTAAINALTATTATLTALNLSTPLPVTSGGTGANNAYDALTNFGVSVMGRYLFNSTVLDSATAEAVRQTLLNSGTIGDALFVETTASGGRATLGATVMGDYLFSSSVLDTATAASVRQILLNSGTVGDALFVETTASGARTTLGAGEIGDALFVEETATSARSTLGGGAIGSPLFTAANTASAWNILGLTGTLSPTLDIHISGNAANVTGTVAIANGGTGETSASAALDSLFSLDTAPSQTISDSRLSNTGVTPGSYNLVTVDAKGRVTSGSLVSNEQDHITNGVGSSIYTSATDGGYLIFSTASQVQMVLDPNGYLGIGTATPMERLHVNDGNVRISNESSEAGELQFTTDANSRRWIIATGSGTQDFFIDRYDDGGTQIGSALTILRSSGNATFSGSVAATGGFLGTLTGTLYGNVEGDITGSISLEDGTEAAPALYFTDDTNVGIYRPGDDTMGLVTGGSNVLYLTATQSVGLGTTTPSQKLDVNGAINVSDAYYLSATKILHLPADDATSLAVGAGAGDGQTGATLYNTGLGAGALFTNATGAGNVALGYQAGYLVNGGGNNVIIGRSVGSTTLTTGSGNVLIGTSASVTTPAAGTSNWLNIGNTLYGDLANRRIILTGATATAGTTPSEGTIIDLSAASGTAYSSLLLPRDTMDNRPTVGITGMIRYNTTTNTVEAYQGATAAWQTLLTSTGTAGASAYLGPSAVITNPSRGDDITTGLFSGTAGTVSISISGTERLRVTATGSVGIGTETPSQLLEVNGSINVTATSGAYNIANLKMLHMPGSDDTSIAVGPWALGSQTGTGLYNTAMGVWALSSNSSANNNAAFGAGALSNTTTGNNNTALGAWTLGSNITGINNTAVGAAALNQTTTGSNNSAFGIGALYNALSHNNSAFGFNALSETTTGGYNTAFGAAAGNKITSGFANLVLGPYVASTTLTTGSNNILIGYSDAVDTPAADTSSWLNIGNTIYADLLYKRMILTGQTATAGTTPTTGTIIDLGRASGADYSSVLLPKDTSANRPVAGVQGMIRYNTDTNALEAYVGATGTWSSLLSSTSSITGNTYLGASAAANNPSRSDDVTTGLFSGTASTVSVAVSGTERLRATSTGISITGDAYVSGSMSVNGLALLTGSGTQNYLVKWTTTDTLGTGMVYDTGTSVGIGTTTPTTGTILDMGAATGTAYSSILLPKDTSANRPTGVAGMLRYNTTTAKVEAYQGTAWETLSGTSTAGSTIYLGPSAGASSPSREDDVTTGLFSGDAATVSVSISGTERLRVTANGANLPQTANYYAIGGIKLLEFPNSDTTSIAVGYSALNTQSLTNLYNTAVGYISLAYTTTGARNTAVGYAAMIGNSGYELTGSYNTALGSQALYSIRTTASANTAVGANAAYTLTTGTNNTILGNAVASAVLTTGASNILIGTNASVTTPAADTSNWLNIGNTVYGDLANRRLLLTASATASVTAPVAGTILDLGGATGTAYSSVLLPKDTSANRPTSPVVGMLRYNTTTYSVEAYQGSSAAWVALGGGGSLGISTSAASPARSDDATTGLFSGTASTVSVAVTGTEMVRVTGTSVGIGTTTPKAKLDVNGGIGIGNDTSTCDSSKAGIIRWTGTNYQGCNGTDWTPLDGACTHTSGSQLYTSTSTWSPPSTVSSSCPISVRVLAVGGGGGGGFGNGAGGGASGYVVSQQITLTSTADIAVTVGSGGVGSTTYGVNGGPGGTSSFGAYFYAKGGDNGSCCTAWVQGADGGSGGGNGAQRGTLGYGGSNGGDAYHANGGTTPWAICGQGQGIQFTPYNGSKIAANLLFSSATFSAGAGSAPASDTGGAGGGILINGTGTGGASGQTTAGGTGYGGGGGGGRTSTGGYAGAGGAGAVYVEWDSTYYYSGGGAGSGGGDGGDGGETSTYLGASTASTSPSRSDDVTTGLFSGTAATVSVAASGTEMLRVTSTSIGIKTTSPTTGTILDLGSATGTAYSSLLLPQDTSANRPTGVVGMIRYNTTTNAMEAYQGSSPAWVSLGSSTSTAGSTIYLGPSTASASPSRSDDATTGLFSGTAATVSVAISGTERLRVTASGLDISSSENGYYISETKMLGRGAGGDSSNIALGNMAFDSLSATGTSSGRNNTAMGMNALNSNNLQGDYAGSWNVAIGQAALYVNTASGLHSNAHNIAIGQAALQYNSGVGEYAASYNNVVGAYALQYNSGVGDYAGSYNNAFGYQALHKNTGSGNTAIGTLALGNTTATMTGSFNVALGYGVGSSTLITGSNNILIGTSSAVDTPAADTSNWLNIGNAIKLDMTNVTATNSVIHMTATDNSSIGVGLGALANWATNNGNNTAIGANALNAAVTNRYNTAVGYGTLKFSTAQWNTALGTSALGTNVTGAGNVGVGGNALFYNKGDGNTAIGQATIQYSATAHYNTALGYTAMFGVSSGTELTGSYNTALGASALYSIQTTASGNTAVGGQAMYSNTTGYFNTAMGYEPLRANTTGYMNIGIGYRALYNANSYNNLALGNTALYSNTSGYNNVGLGHGSMYHMATGRKNVSVGNYAFYYNTAGWFNTAVGNEAMLGQSGFTGHGNTALGNFSLYYLDSTAGYNTGLGYYAGMSITTGSSNVVIGPGVASAVLTTGASNILIGTSASVTTTAADTSNWLNIGNTIYGDLANRRLLLTASATASVTAPVVGTILDLGGATGTAYSSVLLPKDTSANRPTSPVVGMLRYNTTTAKVEAYQGGAWETLSGTSTSSSSLGTSAGAASPARSDDATTGLFSGTSATVSTSISGTERLRVTANGIDLAASGYLNYYAIGGLGVLEFPYGDTSSIAVGYDALTAQNTGNRYNTAVGRSALATATGANYNTALGNNALNDLGNGTMNTAVGAGALQLTTTGNYNTAVGAFSSYYVTGTGNTGLGNYAMVYAGSGNNNTAVGNYAMASNSSYQLTGNYNTAVGDKALYSIRTTASGNTAIGGQALYSTTTAGWNSALGYQALYSNTTGVYNIAVGYQALYSTSTGLQNTVVGTAAAYSNTGGSNNQALGGWALYYNTTGHNNTAIGDYAINGAGVSLTGSYNAALGTHALYRAQGAASNNVGIGYQAGSQVTTGGNNTILGQSVASTTLATGSYNILIGYSSAVDTPAAATTYWLNIGNTIYGDLSNRRVLLTGATATSGTAATAGTILDMSAAGGTSYSSILLPKDTSANRPGSPVTGMLRYNTTTYTVEAYQGSSPAWTSLSGGSSTHYFGTSASSTVPSRSDDATTGLFSGTAATVSVSISGTERLRVSATGANLPQTANGYAIANTSVLEFPNSDTYSIAVGSGALNAQSVSTAYNTGLGYQALPANTTGLYNTAVGGLALTSNVSGGWNVAVGVNALYSTTASFNTGLGVDSLRYNTTGNYNTAIGMQTMYGNGVALTGTGNTAMGAQALYNVRGATSGNTAVGASAMYATTTGVQNTVVGYQAMVATTTGMQNTAVGYRAMAATTNGSWNAAFGQEALQANTTGFNNTALGVVALHQATTASNNTAVGVYALNQLTTGYSNIAMGTWAGGYISTGNENTAIGMYAMYGNTSYKVTGSMNTALGYAALYSIRTTAQLNVAVGASALYNTTTGSFNVAVGYQALYSTATGVHSTAVGHGALYSNTVTGNTAVGVNALYANTTGASNTAVGEYALKSNTTGYTNTAVGSAALYNNTTGVYNTGIGAGSLQQNLTGLQNTAVGTNSLTLNTGNYNAAFGATALYYNTSGEGNAGLGTGALFTNTTGSHNTAAGTNAMNNNATGSYNTAVGSQAMYSTSATATRLTGTYNTAVGYQSLYAIQTTASANTAVGAWAGYSNTTGVYNTSLGLQALYSNTTGMGNMAAGVSPLYSNTTGNMNVALGNVALASNTTGSYNVAVGYMALNRNSTPSGNVAIGNEALYSQTTPGAANMAIGYRAGYAITTGQGNTVMGYQALLSNVTGNNNTAIGYEALRTATSNGGNVGIGVYSLVSVTNGYNNVAVGNSTGLVLTTGYQNTILGNNVASTTLATGSNNILIGTSNAVTTPAADSTYFLNIGGVINANMSSQLVGINRGTTVASYPFQVGTSSSNGNGAYLTAAGVWTNASDRRLKENIRTSPYGLKALMKLKPSAYEMIGTHDKQIGFIAQDVAEVVPEVVSVDKEGRYGLSYGNLLTVAVKAIQEMKTSDDEDKEKIDALIEENRKLRQDLDKVMKTLSARNRAESRVASSVHTAKIDARLPAPNAQVLTPAEDGEPTQTVVILAAAGGGVIVILLGGLGACVFMLVRARRELKRVKKRRRRS